MHPGVMEQKPGKCPKCGMQLESAQDKKGHDKHAGHSVAMFRDKFWLSLALTIPVLIYSETIQRVFGFTAPVFSGSDLIPLLLSTVIFFYGGLVFLRGAVGELKAKLPGMMTLIAMAISVAYIYSVGTEFVISGEGFFWELSTLITIMLLGHWLEMASIKKAQGALDAIAQLLPDKAEKLVNGQPQTVLVSELKINDLVLIRPGSAVPVDGAITEGTSSVNEAAITGESKPVAKKAGDEVIAGTINQDGSLTVKVTKIGENTALAGIMRLVAEAQASKSNVQVLADKAAFVLTIVAITFGLLTFLVWILARNTDFALERSVTVLIIACPHALGLAIPLVVSISTTLSARNGLLIRKRLALESARNLDWVLFDKTGTLTKGEHGVTNIWSTKGYSEEDILRLAASLEASSEHIVGKGIVKKAQEKKLKFSKATDFKALPGVGVEGKIGKTTYVAAGSRYIEDNKLSAPSAIKNQMKQAAKEGKTEVYLIAGKYVIGALALADIIREESKPVIAALRKMGIKTAMITGDSEDVASYVAKQLDLDQYFAQVKPEDKASKVKQLQARGESVAMVGDGINDAPALTQANIGLAIGAGTDVAIKSADIILVKSDPRDVVKVIKLSKATYSKMKQNLAWATGYNVVAIPLAAGVLYKAGILLVPALGAALMSLSTIIVALNAQLLRRLQL
ncbi:heavy metal translocating P-type ATPase [Candidatus Saccharibacteria bacterium]|nr:heavy metal translocating P-type ATPase [Candidatus Saccharibacteria bacterium]